MKSFAIVAVVAAGVLLTSGTADAQIFRGGGSGYGGGMNRGYNSYPGYGYSSPGYGYSNPGYGYSNYSNGGYGYRNAGYSNYSYPNSGYSTYSTPNYGYPSYSNSSYGASAYIDPCSCIPGTSYYSSSGTISGYTQSETTGTIVTSGYTPVDTTGTVTTTGGSSSPEGTYYSYPSGYTSYPSTYSGGYSYPMNSGGRSSRGLFGMRR